MEPIVRFENVSKRFVFSPEKPQTILETVTSSFRRKASEGQTGYLWALHDVSFDVMPGQCVGLVGRNGSGKSTALKLTTGIFRPTKGRVVIGGRVSALLELGAGFHPDLTGRENIFLNGSLLGLSKAFIESKFDDIVAFSELNDFIDMPVKHYSSGMYMRLGFSVSIHVEPEILIIDEILAVGDSLFQTKCIDRIYEMKERGVTILLVSHNLEMMRRLSTNLVWLEKGEMQAVGPTEEVAELYAASGHAAEPSSKLWLQSEDFERYGNGEVEITAVHMYDAQNQERNVFQTGQPMAVDIHFIAHRPVEDPEFGLAIHTQDGVVITSPNNRQVGVNMGTIMGSGIVRYCIDSLPLLPAKYTMTVAVHDGRMSFTYDYHKEAYPFRVMVGGTAEYLGLVAIPATWSIQNNTP